MEVKNLKKNDHVAIIRNNVIAVVNVEYIDGKKILCSIYQKALLVKSSDIIAIANPKSNKRLPGYGGYFDIIKPNELQKWKKKQK